MTKNDLQKAKERIDEINKRYATSYKECYDAAAAELREQTRPGQVLPKIPGIATQNQRDILRGKAQELRAEAQTEIDKLRASIDATKTEAPSEDATRYVTMLAMRGHITQDDIDLAATTYGGNFATLKALNNIALRHDLMPHEHPIERTEAATESLARAVGQYGADLKADPSSVEAKMNFVSANIGDL